MRRCYAELGYGNKTFFSTEICEPNSKEKRIPKFIFPKDIDDYYMRIWVGKRVYVLSSKDGPKIQQKKRYALKILFGIAGECKYNV